jgi:hypothetical protein
MPRLAKRAFVVGFSSVAVLVYAAALLCGVGELKATVLGLIATAVVVITITLAVVTGDITKS